MSWLGTIVDQFGATILSNAFALRNPWRYEVCTQYESGRMEGEWVPIFIGVTEQIEEAHPDFPAGRQAWQPVRTYWGEYNNELRYIR
jgi:hypothetical protein